MRLLFLCIVTGCFFSCQDAEKSGQPDLKPIAFSQIEVGGEMQTRAMKNFDRLETDIYTPENVFPVKHETVSADWPGDYEGRIILGLTLQAQATKRTPVYLDELIKLIPEKLNEQGYLGPVMKDSILEQQLSGHGWFLRALSEYYEWKKDPAIKKYITDIINNLALPTKGFHKNYPIDPKDRQQDHGHAIGTTESAIGNWKLSSDIGCDFIFMDGVIQAYSIVPSPELKSLIDEMVARFLEMDLVAIKAQTHATLTGLRALLRYHEIESNPDLLKAAEEKYLLYRNEAMTENFENYNWFGRPEWTEPCAIIDAFMVATQLWMHTENSAFLEDAHQIYYNAIAHTQRTNGGFGLDNCIRPGDHSLKVIADEAYWCCTMRGGEGLAKAIQYNYFTGDNSLFVTFFNNSKAEFLFGDKKVVLSQSGNYPYGGNIKFTVGNSDLNNPVDIAFFAPKWGKDFSITVNGQEVDSKSKDGFILINDPLKSGTVIEFNFEMNTEIKGLANNADSAKSLSKVLYGPLVLGYETSVPVTMNNNAEFIRTSENTWMVKGTNFRFSPVFHVLSPRVSMDSGYSKQVIFDSPAD